MDMATRSWSLPIKQLLVALLNEVNAEFREAHESIKDKRMKEELGGGGLLEVKHEDDQRMAETVDVQQCTWL